MKPIPGLPDYFADEEGQIWSAKLGIGGRRYIEPHVIRPWRDKRGYLHVTLTRDGRPKRFSVSRLVALAFHGEPPPDKPICRHVNDRDPGNNRPGNLAWGSQSQNKADEIKHGTKLLGSRLPWAVIDEAKASEIKRLIADGIGVAEVARRTGVNLQTISGIRGNRAWKHVPWPEGFESKPRPRCRLTGEQAREIKALLDKGEMTQVEIGKRYGISDTSVRDIKAGKRSLA